MHAHMLWTRGTAAVLVVGIGTIFNPTTFGKGVRSVSDGRTTESMAAAQLDRLHCFVDRYPDRAARSVLGRSAYDVAKRAADVVLSLVALLILLVPGALLSLVIALDTKGSPIYVDRRIGHQGHPLKVLKFRSMYADAGNVGKYFTDDQLAQWEIDRKVEDDPRITPVGRFLRKTSLDEVPQFINVLLGQMSLVGPRPITKDELLWFGDDAGELLSCRPGITGLWQTLERNDATYDTGVRQQMELAYVRKRCVGLDFRIVGGTFGAILGKTGR